jgi:thymidylate synthase (FAD)
VTEPKPPVIRFRSDIGVSLIRSSAADSHVVQAAQVSVKGRNKPGTEMPRLISYLVSNRHGSPFEHNSFTFYLNAPIFVFREWWRHRMASINEMSGRYTVLKPDFYVPAVDRAVVNGGNSARPEFAHGTNEETLYQSVVGSIVESCTEAWAEYDDMIKDGVANEIARLVLPVNVYSEAYWTVNARGLMNFLSLRTDARTHGIPEATLFSRPQREIEMGAEQIEAAFAAKMPLTHAAFVANGRIAP